MLNSPRNMLYAYSKLNSLQGSVEIVVDKVLTLSEFKFLMEDTGKNK